MIYLITDGKYLKVGYTTNIKSRMKQYATHTNNFRLLSYKEGGTADEEFLHKLLNKYLVRDEWFEYSDDVISTFNKYDPILENTVERSITVYTKHLEDIYRNCTGVPLALFLVLCEELKPPVNNEKYSIFNAYLDDKDRWAKKLQITSGKNVDVALKKLLNSGAIFKLYRGVYAIHPKYAFCGTSNERLIALQEITNKNLQVI